MLLKKMRRGRVPLVTFSTHVMVIMLLVNYLEGLFFKLDLLMKLSLGWDWKWVKIHLLKILCVAKKLFSIMRNSSNSHHATLTKIEINRKTTKRFIKKMSTRRTSYNLNIASEPNSISSISGSRKMKLKENLW